MDDGRKDGRMARFTQISDTYDTRTSSHIYVAQAEVEPGHVVTRTHAWMDRFGPVRGSHSVEYSCTCGAQAIGGRSTGPHGSDLERLTHFGSEAERQAAETEQAERLARILDSLGGSR